MRCLTLADLLKKNGCNVFFICKSLQGSFHSIVENRGYILILIENTDNSPQADALMTIEKIKGTACSFNWLIVDHYGLDVKWERALRAYVGSIMVIDDLANRNHDCDVLLDQNYTQDFQTRYNNLVPASCRLLLGPRYALLRDEFFDAVRNIGERNGTVKRVLVFFGGSDATGETLKTLNALQKFDLTGFLVDVVVGASNPHKELIEEKCSIMPATRCFFQIDNIASLMAQADLSLGAGGTATWERCFLGLPTITIIVASNQIAITQALAEYGAIYNLGFSEYVSEGDILNAVEKLTKSPKAVRDMSTKSVSLIRGLKRDNHPLLAIMKSGLNDV